MIINNTDVEREVMYFDVIIVGGGAAGLCAAIRLQQLVEATDSELTICLVEKASEIGAHIVSGAVLEMRALNELLPDWKNDSSCPIKVEAKEDRLYMLTSATKAYKFPDWSVS